MTATMSQLRIHLICMVALMPLLSDVSLAQGDEVEIPDAGLEAALRLALERPQGAITSDDLESLQLLDLSGAGICDLTGLEGAVNLLSLDISDNGICDLTPIAPLTELEELDISHNPLGNVGFFSRPAMRVFRASGIGMDQIGASFPNLEVVDLSENLFRSTDSIATLTTVEELNLSGNPIWWLTGFENFTNLVSLDISICAIEDIDGLEPVAAGLEHLSLAKTPVGDLSSLEEFVALVSIDLTDVPSTDIEALTGLDQLATVSLNGMFLDLAGGSDASVVVSILNARGVAVEAVAQREIDPVTVPSSFLEAILRSNLGVSGRALTTLDMARLGRFGLDDEDLDDLSGLGARL